MNERENMLSDVITGAIEGGTGYWAYTTEYSYWHGGDLPTTATLEEMEEPNRKVELNIVAVENAMFRIAHDPAFEVNSETRKQIVYAMATNDAGDIDSDIADVIAQCAAFGEIVYG